MRQILLIIIAISLTYSCNVCNTNDIEIPTLDTLGQAVAQNSINDSSSNPYLSNLFAKALLLFPNDSASLYRFYFEWFPPKNNNDVNQQIKRLENLTSNESVERYRNVDKTLKPLIIKIVNSNTMTKSQSDSLTTLYSDYDYFTGESLFSKLLNSEEEYKLLCKSFQIMANESSKDTCFIFELIKLNDNIRTNVELSEGFEYLVVDAIKNNPTGFLEMYDNRQLERRKNFANHICVWDEPDKELIEEYTKISKNSLNENYRYLAEELIREYKKD